MTSNGKPATTFNGQQARMGLQTKTGEAASVVTREETKVSAKPPVTEYTVIVPENRDKKRYSILQFNGPLNVDPGHWPQLQLAMAREDNRAHTIGPSEIIQDYGEGSEYGRAAREEARRKKYGRQTRVYHHDKQPWQLIMKDPVNSSSKERYFRSVCEGGAGAHSDYWVFLKSGANFHAHKVDDWYRFMPNPQNKSLDIDQVEEQFQHRNKVLNQFALKAKIQQTLKDQENADGERMSKPVALKIKDEASSEEEEHDVDESQHDEDGVRSKKKSKGKKGSDDREHKDKKQRVKNADEVAAYESEDGEDEGREYDYISDSGSDTSREELTVDEKVEKALVAVGDETGMRDDVSDEEDEDAEEEDGDNDETKQKRQLLKKLNEQKDDRAGDESNVRITDKVDKRDSSGSDTDDPDNPESRPSVLFLQAKSRKRVGDDEGQNGGSAIKRTRTDSREQTPQTLQSTNGSQQLSTSSQQPTSSAQVPDGLNEETVRRLLMQRPLSTKDLVSKIKPKIQNMSKEEIVARLAEILRVLRPEQVHRTVNRKQVLYFSLARNN